MSFLYQPITVPEPLTFLKQRIKDENEDDHKDQPKNDDKTNSPMEIGHWPLWFNGHDPLSHPRSKDKLKNDPKGPFVPFVYDPKNDSKQLPPIMTPWVHGPVVHPPSSGPKDDPTTNHKFKWSSIPKPEDFSNNPSKHNPDAPHDNHGKEPFVQTHFQGFDLSHGPFKDPYSIHHNDTELEHNPGFLSQINRKTPVNPLSDNIAALHNYSSNRQKDELRTDQAGQMGNDKTVENLKADSPTNNPKAQASKSEQTDKPKAGDPANKPGVKAPSSDQNDKMKTNDATKNSVIQTPEPNQKDNTKSIDQKDKTSVKPPAPEGKDKVKANGTDQKDKGNTAATGIVPSKKEAVAETGEDKGNQEHDDHEEGRYQSQEHNMGPSCEEFNLEHDVDAETHDSHHESRHDKEHDCHDVHAMSEHHDASGWHEAHDETYHHDDVHHGHEANHGTHTHDSEYQHHHYEEHDERFGYEHGHGHDEDEHEHGGHGHEDGDCEEDQDEEEHDAYHYQHHDEGHHEFLHESHEQHYHHSDSYDDEEGEEHEHGW